MTKKQMELDVPADDAVVAVWDHYVAVFADRLRVKTLTEPRTRVIRKALRAVNDDASICKAAIDGLKSYRTCHPDGSQTVNIDVIFATGPHSHTNLTDQVEWWAAQADTDTGSVDPRVPSLLHAKVHRKRQDVAEMLRDDGDNTGVRERGERSQAWLRQNAWEEVAIVDGKVTTQRVTP